MKPRARNTDPSTSHQAARSVKKLRAKQQSVLRLLKSAGPDGLTLEELTDLNHYDFSGFAKQSESGCRTRCCELVRMGLVRNSGRKRPTRSGRKAIVWEVR